MFTSPPLREVVRFLIGGRFRKTAPRKADDTAPMLSLVSPEYCPGKV
jgi:hypothetical protein